MSRPTDPQPGRLRIWRAPFAIGATIAAGLAAALFIDGLAGQIVCSAALLIPILVVLFCSIWA